MARSKIPSKYDNNVIRNPELFPEDIRTAHDLWKDRNWNYYQRRGDVGTCVLGAGFLFMYQKKWYFMSPPAFAQGSMTWEHAVNEVQDLLVEFGAEQVYYDWGMMD